MKILVLSDSHGAMEFMCNCVEAIKPQAIVHLGDYYEDGQALAERYPHIALHQVPGNCDRNRCPSCVQDSLCYDVCGVRLFMTHGHKFGVKFTTSMLTAKARETGAQAVLYGHTHQAQCRQEKNGMWVMNPGASGNGSAGLIETENKTILSCKIITAEDLEEIV